MFVIYTAEENSDVLAVHTVRHTAVSRDAVAKVLDVEGALEARGEEAAERGYERGKAGEEEQMEVVFGPGDGLNSLTELNCTP